MSRLIAKNHARILTALLFLPAVAISGCATTSPPLCRVARVVDGDTLRVITPENLVVVVRVEGIQAPEKGRRGYDEAKAAMTSLVLRKWVRLEQSRRQPIEKWNRVLARVFVGDMDVGKELLARGLAVPYR